MTNFSLFFPVAIALALFGCSPNDPRLAEELYKDALELSNQGKVLESRALMEEIAKRWPEKLQGITANQDIFRLNAILSKAEEEKLRQARQTIRATCDALARYYVRNGEYPNFLSKLVPDYGLDQVPMTPWGHPLFYRPFASAQSEQNMRGRVRRFDSYYLANFGTDLAPGGEGMAADMLYVNGRLIQEKQFPPVPSPQPLR
ncbi:MAG: type II secretion system protein GspG [Holophagales bacterium]|jgi:hypothetical protein|nr:type II secretion system protein GspG [Holophagales bacterium]